MAIKINQLIITPNLDIFDRPEAGIGDETPNWSKNLLDKSTWDKGTGIYSVTHIGINALPGTTFTIDETNEDPDTFMINNLGVFQLDTTDFPLTHLRLSKSSFDLIKEESSHYIIIDLVYKEAQV